MVEEQRRAERHRVRFKLVYDDGDTFNAGVVRDVSETGLFLETGLPLPVNTEVILTPLDADEDFNVRARVVRQEEYLGSHKPGGMGLEFVDTEVEEGRRIVEAIRKLDALGVKIEN